MTHSEDRSTWVKEGLFGLGTGILFGATNVAVGQPFDVIKTKMQSQNAYLSGDKPSMAKSFMRVIQTNGVRGLYAGSLAPLLGSGVYRSTQFAVFEALYTKLNSSEWQTQIPYTQGLQQRVVVSAIAASTARAILECPIEYAKVARQTQQGWLLKDVYTGFQMQWVRTSVVMTTYFCVMDHIRRNHNAFFSTSYGAFLSSAGAATLGFWLVWPAEVLKNQIQAHTVIPTSHKGGLNATITVSDRLRYLISEYGVRGLYRGILPGTMRSFFGNGAAMVVMKHAQQQLTAWGWRDK